MDEFTNSEYRSFGRLLDQRISAGAHTFRLGLDLDYAKAESTRDHLTQRFHRRRASASHLVDDISYAIVPQ